MDKNTKEEFKVSGKEAVIIPLTIAALLTKCTIVVEKSN